MTVTAAPAAGAVRGDVASDVASPRAFRRGLLVDVAVGVILFVVAATVLLQAVETVPFHGDESEWINTGRYFRFVFLDHDVTSSVWRPSWLNRDQPPVGRYIIGGIVWASGTDPAHVNRSYAWEKDMVENREEGRIPGQSILLPVRRTMAVLGALSIVLLFVAGRQVGGTLVGAVAGIFAIASPLLQGYFVQARTEALLALFSVLALVALLAFARRYNLTGRILPYGWVVGLILGMALATKLTAAVAIVGTCAYGLVAAVARFRAAPREAGDMLRWTIGTGVMATVVWVVVNPFLWPDPIGRTWSMLTQQQSIMEEQGEVFGHPVEVGLPGRMYLMVRRTFVENSTPSFDYGGEPGGPSLVRRTFLPLPTIGGMSLELALAIVGLVALVQRAVNVWTGGGRHGVEMALLWWLGGYFLLIAVNLSLDWPRYYVPTAFFGALLIGLGAHATMSWARVWLWGTHMAARRPAPRTNTTG